MPYSKVDTSKLSGYALEYALAKQAGASDAEAHTRANAATGGSGLTQSDMAGITHDTGSTQTCESNPFGTGYTASPYDYAGYSYATQQQQQKQHEQQLAAIQAQMNEMIRRTQEEQAAYQQRLAEAERARQDVEQRISRFTSPEFLSEGAAMAREHMRPGQEVDQARILEAVLRGVEQRGMMHSGITPGLQQRAAQHLDEQYAKKALDIARDLALMGVQGAEGEFDRYLRQLGLEQGAMTGGQQMSWNQLASTMGIARQADQFERGLALNQFQAMAPYMLMTQAEKASHVRSLLQQMGVPAGGLTDSELNEIYDSLMKAGGGGL